MINIEYLFISVLLQTKQKGNKGRLDLVAMPTPRNKGSFIKKIIKRYHKGNHFQTFLPLIIPLVL